MFITLRTPFSIMQPGEKYWRFQKFDRKKYAEVNDALKELTHLTAREWAIARLCADFKADDGKVPMTWIGEHLPELCANHEAVGRRHVGRRETEGDDRECRPPPSFAPAPRR